MSRTKPESAYHELAKSRGFTYTGGYTGGVLRKVGWQCEKGHQWEARHSNIRQGRGCPQCASTAVIPEQGYHVLAKLRGFTYTGGYAGHTQVKVGWMCEKGHQWQTRYGNIQQGSGCPHCAGSIVISEQGYHELAESHGFHYTGGYMGKVHDKVGWQCEQGHKWQTRYSSIKQGYGCPHCASTVILESAYHELAKFCGFTYTGGHKGSVDVKVGWRCGQGHQWQAPYHNIKQGSGCPRCIASKGEQLIALTLTRWGIRYESERRFRSCSDKGMLPFDFYIPKWRILIEYQGVQHYQTVGSGFFGGEDGLAERQRRDAIKRAFAENHGYTLIEVAHAVQNVPRYLGIQLAKATGLSYAEITAPTQIENSIPTQAWVGELNIAFFDFVQPTLLPIFSETAQ